MNWKKVREKSAKYICENQQNFILSQNVVAAMGYGEPSHSPAAGDLDVSTGPAAGDLDVYAGPAAGDLDVYTGPAVSDLDMYAGPAVSELDVYAGPAVSDLYWFPSTIRPNPDQILTFFWRK